VAEAEPTQAEINVLNDEYKAYIDRLRVAWLAENRVHSRDVYEVMRPEDQRRVHARIAQWATYVTPFAEAWWKERGFGVIWPDDNAEPMRIYKLVAA
jgi:hypothetical protein